MVTESSLELQSKDRTALISFEHAIQDVHRICYRQTWRQFMCHEATAPKELIDQCWENVDALMRSGRMLKDGDRSTVVLVSCSGRQWVVKRSNLRGPLHTFVHGFMRSRSRSCLIHGRQLLHSGIRTPNPVVCMEQRLGPLRMRSWIVLEFIEGQTLRQLVDDCDSSSDQLTHLAAQWTVLWSALGKLRLSHGDMKATNFLIDGEGLMWVIDLDGMRRHRSGAGFHRARDRDRARFMKNFQASPQVQRVFRAQIDTDAARV